MELTAALLALSLPVMAAGSRWIAHRARRHWHCTYTPLDTTGKLLAEKIGDQ
jgi:hypothetical protein